MAKLIYAMNVSLDGYMEDEHGSLEWSISDDEVFEFWTDFQKSLDTYLYGHRFYDSMVYWETYDIHNDGQTGKTGEFAEIWRNAEKIVYSRSLQSVLSARTELRYEFDPDEVRNLKASLYKDISIGGAELAGHAMNQRLVDECFLVVHPVILGGGKRAFPDDLHVKLELLGERRFKSGAVHLHYRVIR